MHDEKDDPEQEEDYSINPQELLGTSYGTTPGVRPLTKFGSSAGDMQPIGGRYQTL